MEASVRRVLPLIVGVAVGLGLYWRVGWWGFLVLFPWVGLSITVGQVIGARRSRPATPGEPSFGRRIALLGILPALLLFVPLVNHENFQLEGVVLLLTAAYFSKGVIHWGVAKVFGPLIWGRGFCGWACWYAAVLDWLPMGRRRPVPLGRGVRALRWVVLAMSVGVALYAVHGLGLDVRGQYLSKQETAWMFLSAGLYYLAAVPLAYACRDRRAFCKILCPAAPIMKLPARFARLRKRPSGRECSRCGLCNRACPMDVDVRASVSSGRPVRDTECILCGECVAACPEKAVR